MTFDITETTLYKLLELGASPYSYAVIYESLLHTRGLAYTTSDHLSFSHNAIEDILYDLGIDFTWGDDWK